MAYGKPTRPKKKSTPKGKKKSSGSKMGIVKKKY